MRIGADPDAPWVEHHVPLHAHDGGFDLHAAVCVAAGDRERLERLCQYLCRPPLGQGRLHPLRDGRVAVALQRPCEDPAVIQRILTHLGLSRDAGEALPAARASPWTDRPSE